MRQNLSDEVEQLLRDGGKTLFLPELDGSHSVFGRDEIERFLPHRDLFLFLDEILWLDLEAGLIAARYDLARGKVILSGHFPNNPVWPGVLMVEAVAQSGGFFYNYQAGLAGGPGVMTSILGARFIHPVTPGADLQIVSRVIQTGLLTEAVGQCLQNGKICAVAAVNLISLKED